MVCTLVSILPTLFLMSKSFLQPKKFTFTLFGSIK